jgi:tetratricopeptide (TPR) repeat protein
VYTQLADAYAPPNEAYPKAKAAAQRAIELDSTLAEAHSQLAAVMEQYDLDWPGTKREIDRALALNPSDATVMVDLGVYNLIQRDNAGAIDAALQYARLDPLSPFSHAFASYLLSLAGAPDSAISQYRQSQEIQPGYVYVGAFVDEAYRAKGMLPEALAVNERAAKTLGHAMPGTVLTLVAMNRRAEALAKMQEVVRAAENGAQIPPEDIARCYAVLGDKEKALEYLAKGIAAHSSFAPAGRLYPELAEVVKDPRYQRLMHDKLHLR